MGIDEHSVIRNMKKEIVITPYFSSIRMVIEKAIMSAKESIDIAVAWFTNEDLFNCLLKRLSDGIRVRLILINDDINNNGGLDFQKFINEGGLLYFGKHGSFMHNKYCIIDNNIVCTGSYNYTYFAEHSNYENIVYIKNDKSVISRFITNYVSILSASDKVTDLKHYLKTHPYAINIQASKQIRIRDLYQKAIELSESDLMQSDMIANNLSDEPKLESFTINDVMYKQWDKDICVRSIEVSRNETIIVLDIATSNSFFLYGTGLNKTWHLISDGSSVYASSITVIINDQLRFNRLASNTIYSFSESDSIGDISLESFQAESFTGAKIKLKHKQIIFRQPNNTITCKLHFPKGDYIHNSVSLYEGNKNNESDTNYWHALNISMRLNRISST